MSNTDPIKNPGWTPVVVKGKQFMFLITHPLCYSYIQSSFVKLFLAVIEERKNLRKKVKDLLLFEIWMFL
jgi:hypothetical protein